MTQKEIELLLTDLCARLRYGVKAKYRDNILTLKYTIFADDKSIAFGKYPMIYSLDDVEYIKPYLRPMSSMTDEERKEFRSLGGVMSYSPEHDHWAISAFAPEAYDYLNSHHFDYRGLIEKGLALEAPENLYRK